MTSDTTYLVCVDCAGSLSLVDSEMTGEVIENGLLRCMNCMRHYPILDRVGIFFCREVLGNYLTERESEKIRKLGYLDALVGTRRDDTSTKTQVAVARHWEYQWEQIFPMDASTFETDGC